MKEIQTARVKDYQLFIEFYCQNPECSGREVFVHCKDYEKTLVAMVTNRAPACPLCQKALTLHNVETWREYTQRTNREARELVNYQIAVRDHGPFVNVSEMHDRLPEPKRE